MRISALTTALLCAASSLHAEEAVEPVIVTASRVAESADETLAAVTVIDRSAIERTQAQTLVDVLRGTPGVVLSNSGGRGKLTSLYLRGTGATHTLILIDGVKVGSATDGQVALQDIPAAQIDRVEVVRGPRSSLYGSEAIGGVIQIFTRRGQGGVKPNASLTVGSYGTGELSAGVSGKTGTTWYSVQEQLVTTDGFDTCPECGEPDKDGYRARSGSLRAGHRFASGLETEIHSFSGHSENEYDGQPNESRSSQEVVGGRLGYEITDFWHSGLTLGTARDQSDNFNDGVFFSRFDTVRDSGSWQNDLSFGDHLLTLGFDYQADRVESTTDYDVESRINRGLFAQYRATFGAHDLQLAAREDDNEQFGRHRTGNIAWGMGFGENLRLTAAHGTAFKAPTFNDLYWPFLSNPELDPETAATSEIGLQSLHGAVRVDLRLFRTDVEHLIDWDCTANCGGSFLDDVWQPVNVKRARIDGAELALSGEFAGWAARVAVTELDPRDQASDNVLRRRARETGRVDVDRDFGAFGLGATLIAESDRYDDEENTVKLPGYGTLDLRAHYLLGDDWRVGVRAENVFDQDYQTAKNYAQPGSSYYLTLAYLP